jgi:hypothetical protein
VTKAGLCGAMLVYAQIAGLMGVGGIALGVFHWNHNEVMVGGGLIIAGCVVWNYCTRWMEANNVRAVDED